MFIYIQYKSRRKQGAGKRSDRGEEEKNNVINRKKGGFDIRFNKLMTTELFSMFNLYSMPY